jgi:hypothetical protein
MIHIGFLPEQIDALHRERILHPDPPGAAEDGGGRLKSQGLPHQEIGRASLIPVNTLRSDFRQFQEGGIERL